MTPKHIVKEKYQQLKENLFDEKKFSLAKKVTKDEMEAINIHSHEINGKRNYTISPKLITKK